MVMQFQDLQCHCVVLLRNASVQCCTPTVCVTESTVDELLADTKPLRRLPLPDELESRAKLFGFGQVPVGPAVVQQGPALALPQVLEPAEVQHMGAARLPGTDTRRDRREGVGQDADASVISEERVQCIVRPPYKVSALRLLPFAEDALAENADFLYVVPHTRTA